MLVAEQLDHDIGIPSRNVNHQDAGIVGEIVEPIHGIDRRVASNAGALH